MMRNSCGLVRTHKIITQKIPNFRFCSTDEVKLKKINVIICSTYERESKIVNVYSTEDIKSKSAHKIDISVNTSEVKDTKYE